MLPPLSSRHPQLKERGRLILSDFQTLKNFLSIDLGDTSEDGKLQLLVQAADAAVKQYVKRTLETQGGIVEYPLLRNGAEALVLQETPVLCYRLTGNVANGSPTITGLSSVSNLVVGMPVVQAVNNNGPTAQPFPNGATIQSIDTTNLAVTLTGNCTAATQSGLQFIFGLAVWWDPDGSYGDGLGSNLTGPFPANSLLRQGIDYVLQRDQPDGTSKCGKLTRLSSAMGFPGLAGNWDVYGSLYSGMQGRGTLSAHLRPLWPSFPPGSIKVVYAAGIGTGAEAPDGLLPDPNPIPADLTLAVNGLAAWCWANADTGLIQMQSEGFQGYNGAVAMAQDALKVEGPLGDVRRILSLWRKACI